MGCHGSWMSTGEISDWQISDKQWMKQWWLGLLTYLYVCRPDEWNAIWWGIYDCEVQFNIQKFIKNWNIGDLNQWCLCWNIGDLNQWCPCVHKYTPICVKCGNVTLKHALKHQTRQRNTDPLKLYDESTDYMLPIIITVRWSSKDS